MRVLTHEEMKQVAGGCGKTHHAPKPACKPRHHHHCGGSSSSSSNGCGTPTPTPTPTP